jgi:hypothetical protein
MIVSSGQLHIVQQFPQLLRPNRQRSGFVDHILLSSAQLRDRETSFATLMKRKWPH